MKYKKTIGILLLIVSIILFFRFIGIQEYVNIDTIKEHRDYLLQLVARYYVPSVLIYIVSYILVAALSIPVAVPLTLVGGFAFGVLPAVLYINIGATLGATLTFIIIRYFFGMQIQRAYAKKLVKFNKNIERYGANYLLIARLIALIPFFLINILAALTNVPLKTFMWTTSLGIIPGSLVYAYAGKNIINIDSAQEIFSPRIMLIFAVLILFGFGSILLKKLKIFKNKEV